MENFKITIENEVYKVTQSFENPSLFTVWHSSGTHVIFRKSQGVWDYHEHTAGSLPIPFDEIGEKIDHEL